MRKLLIVAGVPIDDLNMPEALDQIEAFIQSRQPHQVATVNADFVVKVWDDAELRYILNNADMLTADGMPLVWGARWLGVDLRGRVTGADLVPALAERGARLGWRFFLLGGRPGVAEKASQVLAQRYPGFKVVGMYSPPFAPVVEMGSEAVERIRAAAPDVLLVAFGNPKQEKWIYMHNAGLNVPVSIGVGGSLDFVAGLIPRAPLWMQNSGLEWLYRLIQEPGRMWKRYVVDLVLFVRFFFTQWWQQQSGKRARHAPFELKQAAVPPPAPPEMNLSGAITFAEQPGLQAEIEKALSGLKSAAGISTLRLNLQGVTFIDSAGLGMLVNLTKQARQAGKDLLLCGPRTEIINTLRLIKLDQFLNIEGQAQQPAPTPAAAPEPHRANGWLVLPGPARLEAATAREFRTRLEAALPGDLSIILDLSATQFVDSSGIAALLNSQRGLQAAGGKLVLANLSRDVRRVLELSGVAGLFSLADSLESALRAQPAPLAPQEDEK